MASRLCISMLVALLFTACNSNVVYTEYKTLNNGIWSNADTLDFKIKDLDSTAYYNLFLNVRNDNDYEFSNLFLITKLIKPNQQVQVDTLEYEMALPNGEWLGTGRGSTKENKLWLRENIKFPDSGVYTLKVQHAMRKNGMVEGMQRLKGITDVGLQLETIQE
ncbi:gliding motility lipoprotein GldH [Croceivirga radicis]|uniref:Gliding motility lipoprotein GldH n=1 Tax=Croceivirga radicis TaxID=1929488 RepID=A0A1V6LW10_9FLAO|nr:gliding motility lipoprotein GldH [Croceivirga radicis]OQD44196.1 gliding motility lipoprotein GldH [Croceivirga radicis]